MTFRELTREQLQRQLDEMREEKAAAVERVLELQEELKRERNGTNVKVNDTKNKVTIRATDGSSVSNVFVGPPTHVTVKPWIRIGATVICFAIFVPLLGVGFVALSNLIGIFGAAGIGAAIVFAIASYMIY